MTKKTKGLATVLQNFKRINKQIPDAAISAIRKGGKQIQQTARQLSPVDKGNLEKAIKLHEEITPSSASVTIYVDDSTPTDRPGVTVGDYALAMHESDYKLGPLSRMKAASLGVPVGRKFLERALSANRPKIVAALDAALKKAIK